MAGLAPVAQATKRNQADVMQSLRVDSVAKRSGYAYFNDPEYPVRTHARSKFNTSLFPRYVDTNTLYTGEKLHKYMHEKGIPFLVSPVMPVSFLAV